MHIAKDAIPALIDSPDAVARQQGSFGDPSGYDSMAAEYFTMEAGVDLEALLEGLEDDLCQAPHWGYVVTGALTVTYADGNQESNETGDMFYWPPGHTVRAEDHTEFVLFSPEHEHRETLEHIDRKMG